MKLTAELIARSDSALNTLKDRELSLRGLKIPAIENMGVTQDLNDALDFTDNDIRALANFPLLKRLTTLYLSNNLVSRIDPRIAHSLPYLRTLVLTNNSLENLADAGNALGKFPFLEFVSLMGNPLSRTKHYREYLIWKCKKVRVIDYKRVKNAERTLATQLFETADGRPSALAASIAAKATLNRSLSKGKAPAGSGTFEPGRTTNGAEDGGKRWLTAEEKKKISLAIEQSTSLEEIKRLEEKIKLGYTLDDLDPGAAEAKGGTAAKAKGKKQAAKPAEEEQEEEMDEDD